MFCGHSNVSTIFQATISIGHTIISIAQCPFDLVCWLLMPCWEGERTRGTKRRFAFINMITRSGGQENNVYSGRIPTAHEPAGSQHAQIPKADIFMTSSYYFAYSIIKVIEQDH